MYAVLSPRIIMSELRVDRAVADRLLTLLFERGAVGEPIIPQTGARESKVNIVEDEPPTRLDALVVGADRSLGRRVVLLGGAAALLGLAFELLLFRYGVGTAVSAWLRAEIGSPIAAAIITNVVPLAGLGLGWLLELPFRSAEDIVPARHLRVRSAIWSGATMLGVGYVVVRLLS